jgi:hypothetical protein
VAVEDQRRRQGTLREVREGHRGERRSNEGKEREREEKVGTATGERDRRNSRRVCIMYCAWSARTYSSKRPSLTSFLLFLSFFLPPTSSLGSDFCLPSEDVFKNVRERQNDHNNPKLQKEYKLERTARKHCLNLNLLRPSHELHRPRVTRPTDPHRSLTLKTPNHLRKLRVVNRQRTLRFELLGEVGEFEAFVGGGSGGGEEGDDFATEVTAKFALVGGLAAEEVEVDETSEGVSLRMMRRGQRTFEENERR